MKNELICTKVISLLSLYIDGKLSQMQKEFVEEHLKNCTACREKYINLKKLLINLKNSYNTEVKKINNDNPLKIKEHEYYQKNLSAYFDNELPFEDSVRMKKYIMKIPLAREELKLVYDLQKLLHKNLENTQKKMNNDFTRVITSKIYEKQKIEKLTNWTKTVALIFAFVICISLVGIVYYAKHNNLFKNIDEFAQTNNIFATYSIN